MALRSKRTMTVLAPNLSENIPPYCSPHTLSLITWSKLSRYVKVIGQEWDVVLLA